MLYSMLGEDYGVVETGRHLQSERGATGGKIERFRNVILEWIFRMTVEVRHEMTAMTMVHEQR